MTDNIETQLRDFLSAQLDGRKPEVVDLKRIGVGRSRENWIFDAVGLGNGAADREPLILRRDPGGGLVDTDRGAEFALLEALEPSDLPTPTVRWLDVTGQWLGSPPLIMRREPGACDYQVLNGDRPLAERMKLAQQFCDLLAQVHQVDWKTLGIGELLEDPGEHAALAELRRWEEILRRDQLEAYPELELAIDWLVSRAPISQRTVLVHADFKPGNVLLEDGEIVALLDWELAHLGDPMEDLGWITQPLRAGEHLIAGQWEREQLLQRYVERTGLVLDSDDLAWWVAFSAFKTAVMQISGLRSFLEGRSDEPYRPTRRVLSTLLDAVAENGS